MQTIVNLAAAGADGSAAASAVTETILRGFLESVSVKFTNAPATTVLTLTLNDPLGISQVIYTSTASGTTNTQYPRAAAVNQAGAAITNSFVKIYIPGYSLTVALASANHNTVAQVLLTFGESYLEP